VTIDASHISTGRREAHRQSDPLLWRKRWRAWRARAGAWATEDLAARAIWSPVIIGAGVGVYFTLPSEPAPLFGFLSLAATTAAFFIAAKYRSILAAFALAALGFVAADFRTQQVATPILDREIGIRTIEGRVHSVERSSTRERLIIDVASIESLTVEKTPKRVRLSWRGARSDVIAGDHITVRAGLSPPPPPVTPGGFDFGRQLYFKSIGAVGFAVTTPARTKERAPNSIRVRIENLRSGLTERITSAAPGQGGAIVAAVVTGKREAITEQSRAALRDAGLAHLLAISGLHMGLATGIVFLSVRLGLAFIEPIAIRYPVKKWAAAAALASGFAYLMLSGAGWSPRRAFIMTSIFLLAILFDRRAFSLRNVAIAATIILLTTPEALIAPGFQMSFAAVTALIAVYEWWTRSADPDRTFSVTAKIKRYGVGLIVTDLVSSLATAPYALFHFNRVAVYSLPANFIAMPLMAFWIMPAAVIALLLTPFGLDKPAWVLAAAGMDFVLVIGSTVSSWPGAISFTPQWPVAALIAISLGGLWLCLARSPFRLAGVLGAPAAAAIVAAAPRPDLFVAASGGNVGIVSEGGAVIPYSTHRDRFAVGVWNEAIGAAPASAANKAAHFGDCDASGCVATVRGKTIAVIENIDALAEDCARTDLVVALFPISARNWRACDAVIIDKRSVWRRGAHTVRFQDDKIILKTVGETRNGRPWAGGD